MNYLNEDQELMLDSVKEFVASELEPRIEQMEKENEFPSDLLARMKELGFNNLMLPEEHGGLGEGMVLHMAIEEEIAKSSMVMAIAGTANMIADLMLRMGTPEQIEKYLPQLLEQGGGFAFTEPCAGSDSAGIQTTAVREGDEWVINGQKTWISYMNQTDYFLCSAKTEAGVSAFLIDSKAEGFTKGQPFHKLGMRGSDTGELFFDNVRVPADAMIGKEGKGLHAVLGVLDEARLGVAACAVGLAESALEKAVAYSKERVAFGRPIAAFQGLQWYGAEMQTKVAAARALLFEVARDYDEGRSITVGAAQAKLFASQVALDVTQRAIQMCGGMGLMDDFGLERLYRDAKVCAITEGTDEILKLVISRQVFA
ncbi:acyl-CoA dehydrogenase family protein [Gordonibacter pamelaeae]|uniref:acyl-CoA dehydrogenase family protein n=1 Tax=Gordonibacter pamelaeae TaxID=471189 RepID=UPI00242C4E8A|nr:acyl-CoA dehydrogenase family protein [Gordonibacter pamelaeae]